MKYLGVTDVANILYRDCLRFGIDVFQSGQVPQGLREQIVVNVNIQQKDIYFKACFANINFIVPDLEKDTANLIRLEEMEKMGATLEGNGWHNDCYYRYEPDSVELIKDENLDAHFINVRVLFEILNIR